MAIYRQGDILFIPVDEMPKTAQPIDRMNGRIIVAEGEATGHSHAIIEADVEMLRVSEMVDRYLRVRSRATVTHQEHAPVELPQGNYLVRRQREYAPGEIRYVAD